MAGKADTIEEYIGLFDEKTSSSLKLIRQIIKEEVPHAEESLTYGMPAYKTYRKPLVYFGGYSNHIGFYPMPSGIDKFELELTKFDKGKGSVKFPIEDPLPVELIREMIRFRKAENETKYAKKNKNSTAID